MVHLSPIRTLTVAVLAMAVVWPVTAQNSRAQILDPVQKLLKQAQESQAEIFSPVNFKKGSRFYKECEEDINNGKEPEDVRSTLDDAVKYLTQAIEVCRRAEVAFAPVSKARADVWRLNGSELYLKLWNTAESRFMDVAADFEDGDTVNTAKGAVEVEALYRGIELDAIENRYLSPVNDLLRKADEGGTKSDAPKTLQQAQALAKHAEDIINQNRYDSVNAQQAARQAQYEAAHALRIQSLINSMKKENKTSEDLILAGEEPLQQIAAYLHVPAQFDTDYVVTVTNISGVIERMRGDSSTSAKTIKRLESELSAARKQIDSMKTRIAALSELEHKVKMQKEQDDLVTKILATFTEQEAAVVKADSAIVIQIFGLVFPPWKNTIEPQYFGLLSKVKDAIIRIPTKQVSVEGHNEPGGTDQAAQKLSESRADAVAQYLKANISTENTQITSRGFGKSRPIGPNDTPEEKARNRRIEIVITPDWVIQSR